MGSVTPFVKRMRVQGGTLYTFNSAVEDIGININERNNIVKMSHFALLNIPAIDAITSISDIQQNKFNVLAIPGALESFVNSGAIKDSRVLIAESFQNYALNLETNLLSQASYNPALQTTVSERVFWKWLKETGAIRWQPIDTSAGTYWQEENDTDSSIGYNSVVKCYGEISGGSVRTDNFGTYNETYILVPTSYGQTPTYFKQIEDDNYYHGLSIKNGATNILGRETYYQPHPDALDIQAYYDLADSSTIIDTYTLQYDNSTGSWVSGWWWKSDLHDISNDNDYYIDNSTYISDGIYNINLRYYKSPGEFMFRRSKVDCLSLELSISNLKTIYNDSTLTFDKLSTDLSIDNSFDFNAVLVYYSIYGTNSNSNDNPLATNLFAILFLDPPSGNTTSFPSMDIVLPAITKIQSGVDGFGTSYSFRLNIKSDYMLDDTAATIIDESTSAQIALENWTEVFDSLSQSLNILNQHTGTINYISGQYNQITQNETNLNNQILDLQNSVNNITRNIAGTENCIAMYINGNDPIGDSSIYMKNGKIGFFNNNPQYPIHSDVSVKVMDLIFEKAIRDISGNIIIAYGSPLQIGSSTNYREIEFYTGSGTPALRIDTSNGIRIGNQNAPYLTEASIGNNFYWSAGKIEPSSGSGVGDVTQVYVDGSFAYRDSLDYLKNASIGSGLIWSLGKLTVDVSAAAGGVTQVYVDGSLARRDASISALFISELNYATNASVNIALGNYATNTSVNIAFESYVTNVSIATAGFTTNASIASAGFAKTTALSAYATLASPTLTGTPLAPTAASPNTNTAQIATLAWTHSLVDASSNWLKNNMATNASVNLALEKYATNASIGSAAFAKNASFNYYSTNSSIAAAGFTTNASLASSTISILSYVNSSSYYDASILERDNSINRLANSVYMNDPSSLSTHIPNGIYVTFTANESIKPSALIYCTSSGRVGIAQADSSSKMPAIGLNYSNNSISAGTSAKFLIFGTYKDTSITTLNPGKQVFCSSLGLPTTIRPTSTNYCVQSLGVAISPNSFIFNPSPDFTVLK